MENIKKQKNTLKLVGNILFWVVLGLVVVYSAIALFSEQEANSTSVFGISSLSVQSDSMSGTFEEGDLIFVDTTFDVQEVDVDDVITYRMTVELDGDTYTVFNSHRVVGKVSYDDGDTWWFQTKGDKTGATVDAALTFQTNVVGVWTGSVWSGAGAFFDGLIGFLKSATGFFLFIVLPCFAFLVYEVIKFVKVVSDYNVQKAVGDRVHFKEEALAAARAELEAELKAKEEAAKKA